MVIELSKVQFGLKSYVQAWFQTKIALHSVKLSLHYSHFEIAEFSQYQYSFDLVAGNKKAFTSHVVHETEMMQYRAKNWKPEFKTITSSRFYSLINVFAEGVKTTQNNRL